MGLVVTRVILEAVSLPYDFFRKAEAAARHLRISRSAFYAKAMAEFLKRRDRSAITERLNEIYSRLPAKVDFALNGAQLKPLEEDCW